MQCFMFAHTFVWIDLKYRSFDVNAPPAQPTPDVVQSDGPNVKEFLVGAPSPVRTRSARTNKRPAHHFGEPVSCVAFTKNATGKSY
jgi:hypothetical protein